MDEELAHVERQIASDPGNISLLRQLARLYERSGTRYKGQTLVYWLDIVLYKNCSARERNHGTKMLLRLGPAAIPKLLDELSSRNIEICRRATKMIGKYRKQALPAIPKLTDLLRNDHPDISRSALQSLRLIGTQAIPVLESILEVFGHQLSGLQALCEMDPGNPAILGPLTQAVVDGNGDTRRFAAERLVKFGPAGFDVLREILKNGNESAVLSILDALGQFKIPQDMLALVAEHLDGQGVENIGWYAGRVLRKAGSQALPWLIEALKSDSPIAQRHALQALRELGSASRPAFPFIEEHLDHPDWRVRSAAIRALGALGESAKSALPRIKSALEDEEHSICRWAIVAIFAIDTLENSRPIIEKFVDDPNDTISTAARQIIDSLERSEQNF